MWNRKKNTFSYTVTSVSIQLIGYRYVWLYQRNLTYEDPSKVMANSPPKHTVCERHRVSVYVYSQQNADNYIQSQQNLTLLLKILMK